jgi:hypothetical protein
MLCGPKLSRHESVSKRSTGSVAAISLTGKRAGYKEVRFLVNGLDLVLVRTPVPPFRAG